MLLSHLSSGNIVLRTEQRALMLKDQNEAVCKFSLDCVTSDRNRSQLPVFNADSLKGVATFRYYLSTIQRRCHRPQKSWLLSPRIAAVGR
jgi:hypothetical protein